MQTANETGSDYPLEDKYAIQLTCSGNVTFNLEKKIKYS